MNWNPTAKPVKILFILCFWHALMCPLQAQEYKLKLQTGTVDFGRIAATAYPAKTIDFVNNSNEKLAILLVEKGTNVKVNFERRFYQPGEKGVLSVYYEAGKLGEFSEEMKIYTNLDNDPVVVALKGVCISVQECFPDIHNLLKRNVTVVNKITQKPVPSAELTLIHNHNTSKPFTLKMDKNGTTVEELPIGLYDIHSSAEGFEPYASELFLPKTYPNVVIELIPKTVVSKTRTEEIKPVNESSLPRVTSSEMPENKYAANNIVLLLDVSGSMHSQGKFALLQQSINNLVMILRSIDYVSIITYATEAKIVLPGTTGSEKDRITGLVQELIPHGNTQGVKGLTMAYDLATKTFLKEGNNQIILATDGEFSEKGVTDEFYQQLISGFAQKDIKLSILGFGINQNAIDRMKKMATAGQGSYIHISSEKYVKNALIDEVKKMSFMNN